MTDHTPATPGEWWFTGDAYVARSTAPGDGTTVHIATPRRFLWVQTPYGLVPFEPDNFMPYAHVTFNGKWEPGKGAQP